VPVVFFAYWIFSFTVSISSAPNTKLTSGDPSSEAEFMKVNYVEVAGHNLEGSRT
jgi:hypothetical protein